jgi:hypothetical protein
MAPAMLLAGSASATQGALASTSKNTAPLSRTAFKTCESVSSFTPNPSIRIFGQDKRKTGHSVRE